MQVRRELAARRAEAQAQQWAAEMQAGVQQALAHVLRWRALQLPAPLREALPGEEQAGVCPSADVLQRLGEQQAAAHVRQRRTVQERPGEQQAAAHPSAPVLPMHVHVLPQWPHRQLA